LQNQIFRELILKHLNDPQNDLLTQKVNDSKKTAPINEDYFDEIKRVWDLSAETKPLTHVDFKASVVNFKSGLNRRIHKTSGFKFSWIRNVAALFFLGTLSYWIYTIKSTAAYLVKNSDSHVDSLKLSDGSKIMLAEHTIISYPTKFTGEQRAVTLVKGQAFFQIAKDAKHPFKVLIRQSEVKVLGTSFNINYTQSKIDLSVKTGRVSFSPNANSEASILGANEAISYNFSENTLKMDDGSNSKSWLTKELSFVDTPLTEVCEQLTDYYHVQITLVDKAGSANKFNATFKDSSLDEVLNVLNKTYSLKIMKTSNLIILKTI
jgi:transmembrane sensor